MNIRNLGVWAAVLSNCLFALIYLYGSWLKPVSGNAVFAWRVVAMFVVLWGVIVLTRSWQPVFRVLERLGRQPGRWLLYLISAVILASQLWLFMWGPVNGYGIDVAIGYFLFPIVMVCVGRLFFRERLNHLQWLAVALAAAGVAMQLWYSQAFTWVTAWTAGTYPVYYVVRRKMGIPAFGGLLIDISLMLPFVLLYLWSSGNWGIAEPAAKYWFLIPSLGVISALALFANIYASFNLPAALFGMFSYLEPTLLFILAITVLHVPLQEKDIWTYLLIGSGIVLMLWNNYRTLQQANVLPSAKS